MDAGNRHERRMPIKTAVVRLDGDYEGWEATIRTNAPIYLFQREIASGDADRVAAALSRIILLWNFVDDEGEPLPLEAASIGLLGADLLQMLAEKLGEAVRAVPLAS